VHSSEFLGQTFTIQLIILEIGEGVKESNSNWPSKLYPTLRAQLPCRTSFSAIMLSPVGFGGRPGGKDKTREGVNSGAGPERQTFSLFSTLSPGMSAKVAVCYQRVLTLRPAPFFRNRPAIQSLADVLTHFCTASAPDWSPSALGHASRATKVQIDRNDACASYQMWNAWPARSRYPAADGGTLAQRTASFVALQASADVAVDAAKARSSGLPNV
jgi:hypothetical protein